jgi:hypothetical protein
MFMSGCLCNAVVTVTPTPVPEINIEKVILSTDRNGTEGISTFKMSDNDIYLIFQANNLPADTQIRSEWLFVNSVEGKEDKKGEFNIKSSGTMKSGSFTFTRPEEGVRPENT